MKVTMRRFGLFFLPFGLGVAVLLVACSGASGGTSSSGPTITGQISDTAGSNPVIGLFSASTYQFSSNTSASPDDQVITVVGTAPYSPIKTATISGSSYSISLPAGTSGAEYYLVAWDDSTTNGKLDSGETGFFPVKSFPQGSTAMLDTSFISYQGQGEYAADYYISPTTYIQGFSIVGTSGYNFSIR